MKNVIRISVVFLIIVLMVLSLILSCIISTINVYQIIPHNYLSFFLSFIILILLIMIGIKCETKTLIKYDGTLRAAWIDIYTFFFLIINFILFILTIFFEINFINYLYIIVSFIVAVNIPFAIGAVIASFNVHVEHPEYYYIDDKDKLNNINEVGDNIEW